MDLLATVRKEGSRGGTGDFKWSDVQNSSRRENYLGHSLMAPVGRWQKGRDLSWYARGNGDEQDGEDPAEKAERERKREIQLVKQAEEDALARALGLPVADRSNANLEPLNSRLDVDRALKETIGDNEDSGKGVGYGAMRSVANDEVLNETIQGNAEPQDKELQYALKEYKRRHGDDRRKNHDRDDHKSDRHHHRSRRHRSRSHERHHRRPRDNHRDRSGSPRRPRQEDSYRDRSRSPRRSHRDERYRRRPRGDDERRRSRDGHGRRRSRDDRDTRRSRDDRDGQRTRDD